MITSTNDPLIQYIKDDPVRSEIPVEFRLSINKFILALTENTDPLSIVCVSLHDCVPTSVQELSKLSLNPHIAVLYTIWSYRSGAGSLLLKEALTYFSENMSYVKRCVTLSPKTEMAKKFHLKNGAYILQENKDTVNFEYQLLFPG